MSRWKQLLREIHTRSLWQVLGIYLGASWVVLEVVATFIEQGIGPEWAFPGAIFLLLLGLPLVLATAIIQKGIGRRAASAAKAAATDGGGTASSPTIGVLASKLRRLFTWRTALLSGA